MSEFFDDRTITLFFMLYLLPFILTLNINVRWFIRTDEVYLGDVLWRSAMILVPGANLALLVLFIMDLCNEVRIK